MPQVSGIAANLGSVAGSLVASVAPASARPLTIAIWAYFTSTASGNYLVVLKEGATDFMPSIVIYTSSQKLLFGVLNSSGTDNLRQTDSNVVSTSQWYHIAVTWASDGTVTIYVNGVSAAFSGGSVTLDPTGCARLGIGEAFTSAAYAMNGYVASPAIWNAVLSSGEVAALAGDVETLGMNPRSLETQPIWYVEDLRQGEEGAGPHEPVIGSGALVNVGTISAAPSDPPMAQYEASAGGVLAPSRRVVLATPMDVCMNPVM